MLALGMLNPLASSALLTGGIASIAAATLLGGFSWLGWFALMAVPYYALIFLGGIWLRMMVGPFESGGPCTVKATAEPLSTAEIKTLGPRRTRCSGSPTPGTASRRRSGLDGADALLTRLRRARVEGVRAASSPGA